MTKYKGEEVTIVRELQSNDKIYSSDWEENRHKTVIKLANGDEKVVNKNELKE